MGRQVMSASSQLARNPVAVAVARSRLKRAVASCQVAAYFKQEGADATDYLTVLAEVIEVTLLALEIEERTDTPEHRLLRASMNLLVELAKRGFKWRDEAAPALDAALQRVSDLKFKPGTVHDAYIALQARQLAQELGHAA